MTWNHPHPWRVVRSGRSQSQRHIEQNQNKPSQHQVPFPNQTPPSRHIQYRENNRAITDLRDTLLVLAAEQGSPRYSSRVLSLKEEGFGLSILEAEDLAVTTDVELAL